jgi:hypothetical protein
MIIIDVIIILVTSMVVRPPAKWLYTLLHTRNIIIGLLLVYVYKPTMITIIVMIIYCEAGGWEDVTSGVARKKILGGAQVGHKTSMKRIRQYFNCIVY